MLRISVTMLLCLATSAFAQLSPTAEQVKDLEAKFQSERAKAIEQKATNTALERADKYAARGSTALAANSLREAAAAFHEARWLIPALPADLPANVSRVFGNARLRHADVVYSIAYSPDGSKLASASKDGSVRIWDLGSGRELRVYHGHSDPVRAVAWTANGSLIASAGGKEIHFWNPETGAPVKKLTDHTANVQSLAFRPDGKALVSGGDDKKLLVWSVETGKVQHDLGAQQDGVQSVAYSPNGKLIASLNKAGTLSVWNPEATDPGARMPMSVSAHSDSAAGVAFTPDSASVATCGDRLAKIFAGP